MTGSPANPADAVEGTRAALRFIALARETPSLSELLVNAVEDGGLESAVEVASRKGFEINIDELRGAFAIDWGLRRARHLAD